MRYGNVNVEKTKENFGVFILAYWTARQSIRRPMEVTIQQLINEPLADIENYSDDSFPRKIDAKEFNYLHQLYVEGFNCIAIPSSLKNSKERTKRRRNIFHDSYIVRLRDAELAEKYSISLETVKREQGDAIIQFCEALEIVVIKENEHA
ncbi:ArpU family transcriptional regulator [Enterococcus cecorum]|uniref:hypothetical protein n=1 Tax=Enterococcus cecorum TaxID=44008 RepID=UPI0007618300|nr:hypothetical protein [Enterococcus cecorum]CAI3346406.1 ArpU family transcriptional regulator [Enterococcus cecorum]